MHVCVVVAATGFGASLSSRDSNSVLWLSYDDTALDPSTPPSGARYGGVRSVSKQEQVAALVEDVDGVLTVEVDVVNHLLAVTMDTEVAGPRTIIRKIEDTGVKVALAQKPGLQSGTARAQQEQRKWRNVLLLSLLFSIPIMALMVVHREPCGLNAWLWGIRGLSRVHFIEFLLDTGAFVFVGRTFVVSGILAIKHGSPNMETLITLGTGAAYIFSIASVAHAVVMRSSTLPVVFFDTGPMLFTFVSIGRYFEYKAKVSGWACHLCAWWNAVSAVCAVSLQCGWWDVCVRVVRSVSTDMWGVC